VSPDETAVAAAVQVREHAPKPDVARGFNGLLGNDFPYERA